MGYVKLKALEEADRTGSELYEVKSTELTEGTKGFWWCGRYGMHRWEMPIEPIDIDLPRYEHVTICSPIWVFNLSAPMRSFCKQASGQIKKRITYSFITTKQTTKTQPMKWIPCSELNIQALKASAAVKESLKKCNKFVLIFSFIDKQIFVIYTQNNRE